MKHRTILVTGASGYVGGRLAPRLVEHGYRVRVISRDASRLQGRDWSNIEIVQADALDPGSLEVALQGVGTAYYLIHSMAAGPREFVRQDREAARNFAMAAYRAGVEHLIYLGGLGDASPA
ncbi:MAG: NAD(P)H-binding protein, partial [Cyanobacteria bacterium NC_groundwater_1444_Ag_S-0.65um_54_12]|nr:NAD(P)H-binding protein [Cyanobacteria bacterium NC_groundwater_1444_Ag_S-0.65um_54_12]